MIAMLIVLAIAFSQYLQLKHLPGPYYGGDLYSHHGFALNYFANGLWSDPYFVGEVPFYPWLGNLLFMAVSLLPGISLMKAEMFIGLLTTVLSALAFWFLGWQLFKNQTWALVFLLLSLVTRGIPDGAPNLVPWMITIPAWFAFWLRAEETHKLRDKILAGVFMGATGLAHVAFFLAGMGVYAFTVVVETLRQPHKKTAIINAVKMYGPMLVAGALVALLFYGPIIVKYHAKSINPLFEYNGPAIENLGIGWAVKTLFQTTFNFSSLAQGVLSVLTIIGLLVCVLNWKHKTARYAVLWYIAGSLTPLHHLVTRPLLGSWILPTHVWGITIALLVFAVYGIRTVMQYAEKKWANAQRHENAEHSRELDERKTFAQVIVLVGVVLLVAGLFLLRYHEYQNNQWVQFGERLDPLTQAWFELGKWVTSNTGPNAVFLTHDESCFAVNGFTGRKCVFVRRTHANYFVDVEQRYADGIVMLYGDDSKFTNELLKKYSVEYVLLDMVMMQSPVLIDVKYEQYLRDNNVSFAKIRERKDPSVPNSRVFDLLSVPLQPLNPELQRKLTEAVAMNVQDQPVLRLFRVAR